ncbi:MAG: hypothetical protein V4543_14615 [Bacteroidota bacterium]
MKGQKPARRLSAHSGERITTYLQTTYLQTTYLQTTFLQTT